MYIYIYIYTYIHACMHIYIYIYICIKIPDAGGEPAKLKPKRPPPSLGSARGAIYVCMHIWYIYIYIYIHHTYVYTYIIYIYIYMFIHTYILNTYIYIYTHICIYIGAVLESACTAFLCALPFLGCDSPALRNSGGTTCLTLLVERRCSSKVVSKVANSISRIRHLMP